MICPLTCILVSCIFLSPAVQLLHKLSIHAADGPQKLLKVVKNPITDHLPVGCRKICSSYSAEKCVNPRELAESDEPVVIVIGAMAHGKVRQSLINAWLNLFS